MTARPRYGRVAAFGVAVLVTATSVVGGAVGVGAGPSRSYAATPRGGEPDAPVPRGAMALTAHEPTDPAGLTGANVPPPATSGEGRRVVFDLSEQRVWLVEEDGTVRRSHLASGSLTDNLRAGSYEVYSRSRHATGIDGSALEYMVRFTHGRTAAIGFHDIPLMDGRPMQTTAELGTPRSHGCIRQAEPDAKAMWRFASVGTPVVVTA